MPGIYADMQAGFFVKSIELYSVTYHRVNIKYLVLPLKVPRLGAQNTVNVYVLIDYS